MPGLFGIYGLASQSLLSFQSAISVTGHNVANSGTAGFHRQRVDLRSGMPEFTSVGTLGTGVRVQNIQRIEDRFIEAAVQREVPLLARFSTRADALAQSELAFGEPSGSGLTSMLDGFFSGWDDLASSPEDPAARESVVRLGVSLAASVAQARERLSDQQASVSGEIARVVDEANGLVTELEKLNGNILASTRNGTVPADMEDRRDQIVEKLGDLVGATGQVDGNGTATVRLGGRVLVQLEASQPISYDPSRSDAPTIEGRAFQPGEIDGRVGGLLQVRDEDLATAIRRLDEFATRLAGDVNDIHSQGKDLHGRETEPFFVLAGVGRDGVTNAAAGLRVNSRIQDDSTRVAAGRDGTDADNVVALDIAALRSDRTGASGMLQSLVVDMGSRARESQDLAAGQSMIVDSFIAQRESISGVSLDEEAANLLRYQRSYEAAARIMTAVDEMTQTLLAF
jgi:flagellar hook-associated protein 1